MPLEHHLQPTEAAMADLRRHASDAPIGLLHLIQFRDEAKYAAGSEHAACSGEAAFDRYLALAGPLVAAVGGRPVLSSAMAEVFIGPDSANWSRVLIVRFPSRAALAQVMDNPAYQQAVEHRLAAAANWRSFVVDGETLP